MQLCRLDALNLFEGLDFIAGYPAAEGKLTYNPNELTDSNARWIGRVRCIGYAIAHAVSIPVSPLVAAIRIVVTPIFFGMMILGLKNSDKLEGCRFFFIEWLRECGSVVTSPLWNIAGVLRAGAAVIEPKLYLKALYVSDLSKSQRNQLAAYLDQHYSPSRR